MTCFDNPLLWIVSLCFFTIVITDFLYYRVPNLLILILFLLFPVFILLQRDVTLVNAYGLFALCLLAGGGLFRLNLIGGGDVKLFAVSALWVGWQKFLPFLIIVALSGGGVAVFYLWNTILISYSTNKLRSCMEHYPLLQKLIRPLVPDHQKLEEQIRTLHTQGYIPYGIAISLASILMLWWDK